MSIVISIIYYNISYQNINLGINILSLKEWFDNCAKYDNWTGKMQTLEKLTDEVF